MAFSMSRSGLPSRCIVSINTRKRLLSRSNCRSIIENLHLSCINATTRGKTSPAVVLVSIPIDLTVLGSNRYDHGIGVTNFASCANKIATRTL